MRILIINPNSDPEMTTVIERSAQEYAGGEFEIVCKRTPGAPLFIETYEDMLRAAPGMIQSLREHESEFDAFVIACHDDPNLEAMKEITTKPVVGIGEASMKMALMLGHRFSVVSTIGRHSWRWRRTWPRSLSWAALGCQAWTSVCQEKSARPSWMVSCAP